MDYYSNSNLFSKAVIEKKQAQSLYKEGQQLRQQMAQQADDHIQSKRFDRSYFGGEQEVQRLIDRYKAKNLELSKEEMDKLRENAPEGPDFEVLSEEQYRQKNAFGRYKYRRNVKKYFKKRKDTLEEIKEKEKTGKKESAKAKRLRLFSNMVAKLDSKVSLQEKTENYKKKGFFRDVEEDADDMDAAYEEVRTNQEMKDAEIDLAVHEAELWKNEDGAGCNAIDGYCALSGTCARMNAYLRNGSYSGYANQVNKANNLLGKAKLSRDLVVRRGVNGVNCIAHMLNLPNANEMTEDQIKAALKNKVESGEEVIMSDKGFMSTSIPLVPPSYSAGDDTVGGNIGVEFIILAKKGTHAMNVTPLSTHIKESELLIKPGTKLKLVKAQLDGDAQIINGHSKSWKIYLATVPESEEGIRKENA